MEPWRGRGKHRGAYDSGGGSARVLDCVHRKCSMFTGL